MWKFSGILYIAFGFLIGIAYGKDALVIYVGIGAVCSVVLGLYLVGLDFDS